MAGNLARDFGPNASRGELRRGKVPERVERFLTGSAPAPAAFINSASGAKRKTGLFSKNTSARSAIPHANGFVLSIFIERIDPGTKNFSRPSGLSRPSAVCSTSALGSGTPM